VGGRKNGRIEDTAVKGTDELTAFICKKPSGMTAWFFILRSFVCNKRRTGKNGVSVYCNFLSLILFSLLLSL
jgi:hypothetical protein